MPTTDLPADTLQLTARPQLALTLKRSAVTVVWLPIVIVFGLVLGIQAGLVVFVYLDTDGDPGSLILLVAFAGFLLPFGLVVASWRRLLRIDRPLLISPSGLVFRTPRGSVALPWEAVSQVSVVSSVFGAQLGVGVWPQAGRGSPGVTDTLSAASWRVVHRAGLRLSLRVVNESPQALAAAIADLSGGRHRPVVPA